MNNEKEEVKKETEEVKNEEVKNEEVKNEEVKKASKSFSETISGIWNSTPVRFIRKVTKWTLITGGALIGVAAAAKTGTEVALEEHDAKDSEIPDDIPEDDSDIPEDDSDIPEDIPEDSET